MALRVFFLTTEPPYPTHSGGRVRTAAQLQLLASLPEVSEIVLQHLREDDDDAPARERFLAERPKLRVLPAVPHPIHVKQAPRILPLIAARRALGEPYLAGKWASSALARALTAQLTAQPFDVIYVDHLGMMHYEKLLRRLAPGARLVLDQHNVESDFFLQRARQPGAPASLGARLKQRAYAAEWLHAVRFEAEQLRAADAVIAISPLDARAFAELADVTAHVVPQTVPLQGRRGDLPEGDLLYVGNLGWHPNVDGLNWFFEAIWPQLRRRAPALRLRIAGTGLGKLADGSPDVPRAWQQPGVTVLGFVPDLAPLYQSSSVIVAPILGGSGVRIKLLEAMRAGVPLVTNAEAVAGTAAQHGRDLLAPASAEGFVDAVLALCDDASERVRLRDAAYDFLQAEHSLEHAQHNLRRALLGDGAIRV